MEIEKVEHDDRLILDLKQNHTIANLVRKAVWEVDGEAAYDTGHPLGDESNLIVEGEDQEQQILDAVDQARDWMEELGGQLT